MSTPIVDVVAVHDQMRGVMNGDASQDANRVYQESLEARHAIIGLLAAAESVLIAGAPRTVKERMEFGKRMRHLADKMAAAGRPVRGYR